MEGADLQGRGFTGSELGMYLFQEAENIGPSCVLNFQYPVSSVAFEKWQVVFPQEKYSSDSYI